MTYNKTFHFFRLLIVVAILSLAFSELAISEPSKTNRDDGASAIASMSLVGEGRFTVAFWKIYDIQLLAPEGSFDANNPFALKLIYGRKLKGELIAKKSIELIARQGIEDEKVLQNWEQKLTELIPDVDKDDELLGVKTDDGMAIYFKNELVSTTSDPELAKYFFNIWLGEDTTEPGLREKLLNI